MAASLLLARYASLRSRAPQKKNSRFQLAFPKRVSRSSWRPHPRRPCNPARQTMAVMTIPTISDRRLEANRRNAYALTGPARTILPGEDADAFDNLLATLVNQFSPATETEAHQVELLAHNQWRLRRAARLEIEAFEDSISPETGRFALTDAVMRTARYMASIRRSYALALAELLRLQTAREKAARTALSLALDYALCAPPPPPDESNPIASAGVTFSSSVSSSPQQPSSAVVAVPLPRPYRCQKYRPDLHRQEASTQTVRVLPQPMALRY